jgi:hypothetical protein
VTATTEEPPTGVTFRFYGDYPLREPKKLLSEARRRLRDVDFDTVVATGLSGIPAATLIGNSMRKRILLVRKADDTSNHHGGRAAGSLGHRWIFVDDFISSGATRLHVADAIKELCQGNRPWREPWTTEYVGSYLYHSDGDAEWEPAQDGLVPPRRTW